jgi:hypothetical protein
LLPGLYAWLSTVLVPVSSLSGGPVVQSVAWASGAALLVGGLPIAGRFSWLRWLGLAAFVTGAMTTWLLMADQLRASPSDAIQAALGGIGWLLFAVSVQSDSIVPEPKRSSVLVERGRGRSFSAAWNLMFVLLASAGLVPLLLAWRVERAPHAVLAQIVACAAALTGLSLAGAAVEAMALRRNLVNTRGRLGDSWWTLLLVALLLVAGLVLKLF